VFGRHDQNFAGCSIVGINDTEGAAEVVHVRVGIKDGDYLTLTEVLIGELQGGCGSFCRGQRIHDDPAAVSADQRHIGDIERSHLIDTVSDFEEAVMTSIQLGLSPEARIDRVRCIFSEKVEAAQIVDRSTAAFPVDCHRIDAGDESSAGVGKTLSIGKR
jgi:hypothetical protein